MCVCVGGGGVSVCVCVRVGGGLSVCGCGCGCGRVYQVLFVLFAFTETVVGGWVKVAIDIAFIYC